MITLKTSKSQVKIFPSLGGVLGDLLLSNEDKTCHVLDTYQQIDDLEAKAAYKSHFLLPFPNRMKDGKYNFYGNSYQFPVNDTRLGHSLHGFLDTIPMQVIIQKSDEKEATVELQGDFSGNDYYPFSFEINTTYTLRHSELIVLIKIKNTGNSKMPIGFGWHPYFKIDNTTIDDFKMQLPDCRLVELDERMMPTGETVPFHTFSTLKAIGDKHFDNCFILESNSDKRATIQLQSKTKTLSIWQETAAFPYFQIYTPENRQSIAIEPMTCNIDAFNNENGLWVLDSEKDKQFTFGIKLT